MDDLREKVLRGLACLSNPFVQDADERDCEHCSYDSASCFLDITSDALSLLKAQEPRVMTLDEVKAFDWDYCYLEEERLPGKEYRIICGDYALTCITWPCIASMRIQHGDDRYGKKWRCWSAKPTDEQRKAVKWE